MLGKNIDICKTHCTESYSFNPETGDSFQSESACSRALGSLGDKERWIRSQMDQSSDWSS